MSLGATGRSTIIARKPRRRGRIVTLDENELSSWTLKTVKRLKAPDEEGLRNLEFFSLIFLHNSNSPVDQGTYQLSDKNGFQQILFASPFQQNQMVVAVA